MGQVATCTVQFSGSARRLRLCRRSGAWPFSPAPHSSLPRFSLPWRPGVVVGTSMTPTLAPGSVFVYERDYYRTHEVAPGDIVVVRHNGEILIKRIYAAAGDRFWAYRDTVGERLVHNPIPIGSLDRYLRATARWQKLGRTDFRLVRVRVPLGSAFLIGDASDSLDSREFGFVPVDSILGRVIEPLRA